MGFWQALSALAPVAPAMSDARDLRTAREQQQQDFASEQALKAAQLTTSKLAAQGEQQKITQAGQPVAIGEPQWNPTTHSNQILTFDRSTGALTYKDIPGGTSPEERYQAVISEFKDVNHRQPTPEEAQNFLSQTYGYKPLATLTPEQAFTFSTPRLNMSGGVPVVTYRGQDYTSTDISSPTTPPPVKSLLQSAGSAVNQKQSVVDKRLDMEQRRLDMEGRRLDATLKNSTSAPILGDPNAAGESYLATLPPAERALVQGIGTGRTAVERLSYILTRNPRLLNEVIQAYPDFDSSKVQSYISAYRDFTTGKAAEQLKAGANAIQHLYQLKTINDADPVAVHNPASKSYKRYNALLNVVTGELAKFYAMPQTNESREQLRDPIGGLLNRDSGIMEQANAMGVAFNDLQNQWTNAKPSASYQAPLPGLNRSALAALKELAPDQYQQFTAGMVNVQIPGQLPGQIPAAALQKFQHDHPNAQVVQ